MRRIFKIIAAGVLCVTLLAGCQGSAGLQETEMVQGGGAETAETEEGRLALADKKAILLVSFGTSYSDTREKTIEQIAQRITVAYPEYEMRQAYTSQMIIDKLRMNTEDGFEIDNVEEAMQKLADEGFGTIIVQPTHVMAGFEYDKMCEIISAFTDKFVQVVIGEPLLSGPDDFQAVVQSFGSELMLYNDIGTGIVLMGHGTEHSSNAVYAELEKVFWDLGLTYYYVGTVEAEPGLAEIMDRLKETETTKVVLVPLMIVAGDHATNDMAGDDAESWKSRLEAAGYEVECTLRGMGEYMGIQDLLLSHVQDSINRLPQ